MQVRAMPPLARNGPIDRDGMQMIAYLLAKLDSIPEDGTVLDNTMVLWCSELGEGLPIAMTTSHLGGAGGAVPMNRYLQYSDQPHNNLLSSLLTAVGVPTESFGDLTSRRGSVDPWVIDFAVDGARFLWSASARQVRSPRARYLSPVQYWPLGSRPPTPMQRPQNRRRAVRPSALLESASASASATHCSNATRSSSASVSRVSGNDSAPCWFQFVSAKVGEFSHIIEACIDLASAVTEIKRRKGRPDPDYRDAEGFSASRVPRTSSIDFTPLVITATGKRVSAAKSAEISKSVP